MLCTNLCTVWWAGGDILLTCRREGQQCVGVLRGTDSTNLTGSWLKAGDSIERERGSSFGVEEGMR